MKAEHRHELKTNRLEEWLAEFPQWCRDNMVFIIGLAVVAVAAGGIYLYMVYRRNISVREAIRLSELSAQIPRGQPQILESQSRGIDNSYMLIQTADNLQRLAEGTRNNELAALALIKRGEALRTELHFRYGAVSQEEARAQIERARASYLQAIERNGANSTVMGMAKFGLGLCEEELGNFQEAQRLYSEVAADSSSEDTVPAIQAQWRLEQMQEYNAPVEFARAPMPPPPAVPPQPQLTLPEANEADANFVKPPLPKELLEQKPSPAVEANEISGPPGGG
jgi:tetratricopeptide (TPR) repeat protein